MITPTPSNHTVTIKVCAWTPSCVQYLGLRVRIVEENGVALRTRVSLEDSERFEFKMKRADNIAAPLRAPVTCLRMTRVEGSRSTELEATTHLLEALALVLPQLTLNDQQCQLKHEGQRPCKPPSCSLALTCLLFTGSLRTPHKGPAMMAVARTGTALANVTNSSDTRRARRRERRKKKAQKETSPPRNLRTPAQGREVVTPLRRLRPRDQPVESESDKENACSAGKQARSSRYRSHLGVDSVAY